MWSVKDYYLHLAILTRSLFSRGHALSLSNLSFIYTSFVSVLSKVVSSAYFTIPLLSLPGPRSIINIMNSVGHIPDPCIIDLLIIRMSEDLTYYYYLQPKQIVNCTNDNVDSCCISSLSSQVVLEIWR